MKKIHGNEIVVPDLTVEFGKLILKRQKLYNQLETVLEFGPSTESEKQMLSQFDILSKRINAMRLELNVNKGH